MRPSAEYVQRAYRRGMEDATAARPYRPQAHDRLAALGYARGWSKINALRVEAIRAHSALMRAVFV